MFREQRYRRDHIANDTLATMEQVTADVNQITNDPHPPTVWYQIHGTIASSSMIPKV